MIKAEDVTVEQRRLVEQMHADQANFQMPGVKIGQSVRWYRFGQRSSKSDDSKDRVEIAFVQSVGKSNRNVVVRLATGAIKEQVRHIADPKLTKNKHQRENGAWDYTEEQIHVERLVSEVASRMIGIENDLSHLKRVSLGGEAPSSVNLDTLGAVVTGLSDRVKALESKKGSGRAKKEVTDGRKVRERAGASA